jgi:hypothetical protein
VPLTAELEAMLDQLDAMLANSDFSAAAFFRQTAAALRPVLGATTPVFEQHLRAYDYQHARDCLQAARAGLDSATAR